MSSEQELQPQEPVSSSSPQEYNNVVHSASFFTQIKALIKKDYRIMKRNRRQLIQQIFVPLVTAVVAAAFLMLSSALWLMMNHVTAATASTTGTKKRDTCSISIWRGVRLCSA